MTLRFAIFVSILSVGLSGCSENPARAALFSPSPISTGSSGSSSDVIIWGDSISGEASLSCDHGAPSGLAVNVSGSIALITWQASSAPRYVVALERWYLGAWRPVPSSPFTATGSPWESSQLEEGAHRVRVRSDVCGSDGLSIWTAWVPFNVRNPGRDDDGGEGGGSIPIAPDPCASGNRNVVWGDSACPGNGNGGDSGNGSDDGGSESGGDSGGDGSYDDNGGGSDGDGGHHKGGGGWYHRGGKGGCKSEPDGNNGHGNNCGGHDPSNPGKGKDKKGKHGRK